MPRTIQADGRTITVPDDATPDEINQIVGPPPSSASSTPQGSWWDRATAPFTEIQPHQPVHSMSDLGREAVRGVGNIGAGALGVVLHPLDTGKAIVQQFSDVLPSYQMTPLGPVPIPNRAGIERAQGQAQQVINQPLGAAEQAVGQAGALEGAGELTGGVKRIVPKVARGGMDIIAGTGPKVAADLGKTTTAENAAAQADAAKANIDLQKQRAIDLQKHFEKTQVIRAQNEAAQGAQSRKVALNRGVEQLDPKFKEDLSTLRDSVQGKANQMFGDLNAKLDPVEADSSFLPSALESAAEKIKGSNTEPTILRDMEKRLNNVSGNGPATPKPVEYVKNGNDVDLDATERKLPPIRQGYTRLFRSESPTTKFQDVFKPEKLQEFGRGRPPGESYTDSLNDADYYRQSYGKDAKTTYIDVPDKVAESARLNNGEFVLDRNALPSSGAGLTYRDLQGYYSELGRELSKGTLPGDVYHAYDTLQEAISDQMQKIAGATGLGDALTSARQYYRQMKQTFFDPKSPVTKALNTTEAGQAVKQLQGKDQSGIGAIAQYDPELAKRANTVRGYQAEAKSIPARTVTPKPEPTLPPPEPPILADVKKIGLGDIQNAKTEALQNRAESIRNKGGGLASAFTAFDALRNLYHGNLGGVGTDLAVRGTFEAGKRTMANVLENPAVVRFLTTPTPSDIAAIPPDLRPQIPQIVKAAQAQGIKVHPALLTLGAARTQPAQ
jgi:hypothetical protein